MCDEALDDFLPTLNFVPDWFVTRKIIKKLFTDLHADEIILYFDADFGNVVFNCHEMDINFDEDDSGTIILVRVLAWYSKFEKCQALKKS